MDKEIVFDFVQTGSNKCFDKDQIFLYYCIQHLREMEKTMRKFHIYPKEKFRSKVNKHPKSKKILKNELKNPQHYQHERSVAEIPTPNRQQSNSPGEMIKNMRVYFVDSDGIDLDEFIVSRSKFEPQKISSTVINLYPFFHSAKNWVQGDVKFLGLVHPNAEGAKFTSLGNSIGANKAKANIKFSAIGYGYGLPAPYRADVHRRDQHGGDNVCHYPHDIFRQNFQDEILIRLKKNFSSEATIKVKLTY